ncbi:MAG: MFS transporter [Pseudomonadota bacterium]
MADGRDVAAEEEERPRRPLTRYQQAAIALSSVAMGVGLTVNFVVVAPMAREAGLTVLQVAGILTLSTLIYTLMIPVWSRLCDRVGRKRVIVFSLFAMAVANATFIIALRAALTGVATGISAFLLLAFVRSFFGLLSPGLQPASMAAMTDATTAKTRAAGLGLLSAAMGAGSVLGPASAALLAQFGALAPIWASVAFSTLCGLIAIAVLPKDPSRPSSAGAPSPLAVTDRRVVPHIVFLVAYFAAVAMVQQTLAFLIQDRYGYAQADAVRGAGVAFALLAIGAIAVQFGVVQRFKPNPLRMLPVGLALVGAGYAAASVAGPYWQICAFFLIVGAGGALAVPAANAIGSLSVEPAEQAAAAGLLSAAPPAGFILGPLAGALLYDVATPLPLVVSAAAMFGLAAYALIITPRRRIAAS